MILRVEMILPVVFYERINIIFYEQNLNLTKNNNFNNDLWNRIFPYYRFLPVFKNDWIFINHGLFIRGKYSLAFPISKVKFSLAGLIKTFFL